MTLTIDETRKLAERIDGWLADREGELLYRLAQQCHGRGVIVEIGSWRGKSTVWLASGSKAGKRVRVYAIDPHLGSPEHRDLLGGISTFEAFERNITEAGLEEIVVPIVKSSEEAATAFDQPIELIFIDGAHDYESVKRDFELWFPKVLEGGIMAFHDTMVVGWDGPKQLVGECVYNSRNFQHVHLLCSTTYAQKTGQNSAGERLRNRGLWWAGNLLELVRRVNLPKPVKGLGRHVMRELRFWHGIEH